MMTTRARWAWLLLSCLFFGALGDFCGSSFAEGQADPFTHEVYDKGDDWTVTLFAKKVCDLNLFYKDDQKIIISRPASNKSRYDFLYLNKSHNFAPGKDYTLELVFGEYVLSEKAMAAKPKGYTGVGALILNLDLLVDLARSGAFRMRIDGVDFGSFDISGQRQGVARMIDCMRDVDKAAVSDALANDPPKSDLPSAKSEPRGEPAPQRPDEEREASSPAVRYDQGDNWHVDINKADQVCLIDLSLGRQRAVFYAPVLSGLVQYNATFVDSSAPTTKNEYDYEIESYGEVISSGKTNSFAYNGRSYHTVYELTDKILNVIARSRNLLVKFDRRKFGSFDMSGFTPGFDRFFDCVEELGVSSPAKAREESDGRYDSGDDWTVFIDRAKRTCGTTLYYERRALLLNSEPPGARTSYYLTFVRDGWTPAQEEHELEIGNETQTTFSVKAQTFTSGQTGFAVVNGLEEDFLNYITHSKLLHTKAKGIAPQGYLLDGFGHAFERFSDCLKEVRGEASRPKVRRMN